MVYFFQQFTAILQNICVYTGEDTKRPAGQTRV